MTSLREGAALFITTSVRKSGPFLLTKPSPGRSAADTKTGERRGEGDGPSLLLTDSRRIEGLRWARKLIVTPARQGQACCFTPWLFEGSGFWSCVPCTLKWTESPTHARTLGSLKYAWLLHFDPTLLPLPSTFSIRDSISSCVDPENRSVGFFWGIFYIVLKKLITANDLF